MPQSSLFFFTGENSFSLLQELRRWKEHFTSKHGIENLVELDASEISKSALLDAVSSMPFIAEKRLVILHGIPAIDREDLPILEEAKHPDTILLIVSPKPDRRLSIVKDLEKLAEKKAFDPLSPQALLTWLREEAKSLGANLTDTGAKELLEEVGTDQGLLMGELQKLALYSGGKDITPDIVRLLAVPSGTQVIWKLTDLIGSGKTEDALAFFHWQLDRGEDAYGMWAIILNLLKNLAIVWAHSTEGVRSERDVAASSGLHFLSVRNLLSLAREFDTPRMRSLVNWAADADLALKTGGYRYTAERPDEVVALAESAILKCGKV